MTRALLTRKFVDALSMGGFSVIVDAGGLTASVYEDPACGLSATAPTKCVGKLTYKEHSVDYDELMRLIRCRA